MVSNAPALINSQNGNIAFRIYSFEGNDLFDHLQRVNYYSIILITGGTGVLKADFSEYSLHGPAMICAAPYQPFIIPSANGLKGIVLNFHSDFFCIHKNHKEIACSVLFNNIYQPPVIQLSQAELDYFLATIAQMGNEVQNVEVGQVELLVSHLRIVLITASRIKLSQNPEAPEVFPGIKQPFILQNLKDAIEEHYKTKHSPGEYANMLNISARALAKVCKSYFNKTLTALISERLIIEAKRELYLTAKPIKIIASELGFNDEYYFSRFFKNNANISPQFYRDTVGFDRAER
jgi:AraC-like DNA-binding protein